MQGEMTAKHGHRSTTSTLEKMAKHLQNSDSANGSSRSDTVRQYLDMINADELYKYLNKAQCGILMMMNAVAPRVVGQTCTSIEHS